MSGDMNTALGNCVLMIAMCEAARQSLGVQFEIFDDGDDCLLFCEAEDLPLIRRRLPELFLEFGQELKLENETDSLQGIIFCQSRLVELAGGPRMIRDWRKVLSHGTSGVKHWNNPKLVRPMMNAIGHCELALNPGVPILQEYALALIRNGRGERLKWLDVDSGLLLRTRYELRAEGNFEKAIYTVDPVPVTAEARRSFEAAFGIDPAEQLAVENILRNWTVSRTEALDVPVELNAHWDDMSLPELQTPTIY